MSGWSDPGRMALLAEQHGSGELIQVCFPLYVKHNRTTLYGQVGSFLGVDREGLRFLQGSSRLRAG